MDSLSKHQKHHGQSKAVRRSFFGVSGISVDYLRPVVFTTLFIERQSGDRSSHNIFEQ